MKKFLALIILTALFAGQAMAQDITALQAYADIVSLKARKDAYEVNITKRMYDILWADPQAILDVAGGEAGSILASTLVTGLEAPYTYTVNEDGTVTVGEKIFHEDVPAGDVTE